MEDVKELRHLVNQSSSLLEGNIEHPDLLGFWIEGILLVKNVFCWMLIVWLLSQVGDVLRRSRGQLALHHHVHYQEK